MEVLRYAKELLLCEGIEYVSALPLSQCDILKPHLLKKTGIESGSVIIMAVPYLKNGDGKSNISRYAFSKDYHIYFAELFRRILPSLRAAFPGNSFSAFADHSPICEVKAAARSGIGVVGRNGLLITKKYSSFVFLGEIICDVPFEGDAEEARSCSGCGACERACPVGLCKERCISAISQKKGELSVEERKILFSSGYVWGCDICQISCPHSKNASETDIAFFGEDHLSYIDRDIIDNMDDERFSERAYSWRGREVVLRNLGAISKGEKQK